MVARIEKTALMIVPTYNEARNITRLLDKLLKLPLEEQGWRLDVLVMDDSSPDDTADKARKLAAEKYPDRIFIHTGKKEGLGRALQKSFDLALTYPHDVVMTMDADLSHDPADVPRLLQAIDDGADVAIGSRYTEGGMIPGNWPIGLIIRSRIATGVARWIGGVTDELSELTTNFRAVKREVLEAIDYRGVNAGGYGFLMFLANELTSHNFQIEEVPIAFHSRAEGSSKARPQDIAEFFKIAYQMNADSPGKQALRFITVGITGTIVNLLALWQLRELTGSTLIFISFIAIQISIIWNFALHNFFTFKLYRSGKSKHNKPGRLFKRFFMYEGASLLTQVIILGTYGLLSWMGAHFIAAQLAGIGIAFAVNYYIASRYIWSGKRLSEAYAA